MRFPGLGILRDALRGFFGHVEILGELALSHLELGDVVLTGQHLPLKPLKYIGSSSIPVYPINSHYIPIKSIKIV